MRFSSQQIFMDTRKKHKFERKKEGKEGERKKKGRQRRGGREGERELCVPPDSFLAL